MREYSLDNIKRYKIYGIYRVDNRNIYLSYEDNSIIDSSSLETKNQTPLLFLILIFGSK
jgi:hypothetical protein